MKLSKQHQEELTLMLDSFITAHTQAVVDYSKQVNTIALMWRLYNKVVYWDIQQDIYKYCDDTHIKTFLMSYHKNKLTSILGE